MTQNKSIEDVVEELMRLTEFHNYKKRYPREETYGYLQGVKTEKRITESLISLVQQSKEDERERITKIVETWIKTSNPAYAQELFDSLSNTPTK